MLQYVPTLVTAIAALAGAALGAFVPIRRDRVAHRREIEKETRSRGIEVYDRERADRVGVFAEFLAGAARLLDILDRAKRSPDDRESIESDLHDALRALDASHARMLLVVQQKQVTSYARMFIGRTSQAIKVTLEGEEPSKGYKYCAGVRDAIITLMRSELSDSTRIFIDHATARLESKKEKNLVRRALQKRRSREP